MTSKNNIILYNTQFGHHRFSLLHSYEIFNRTNMVNLLEAIENKIYKYDDIIEIDIYCLPEIKVINDLPHKLKVLKIKNTILETLTIPKDCVDLREIYIKDSNLRAIPEIHFLTKLTILNIENADLICIPSRFSTSIISINLSGNSLSEHNIDLTFFPKNIPIILFNNNFSSKLSIPEYQFCYGTQGNRIHKPITNYMLQRNEITHLLQTNKITNLLDNAVKEQSMFTRQTVHISSICSSVAKSILKIKELTDKNYQISNKKQLIAELMDAFYANPKHSNWFETFLYFFNMKLSDNDTIANLNYWIDSPSVHSKTNMTYSELLARVWILIKNHEQKNDFILNVKTELNASVGMCFVGNINRLVNSLIGFVDDINVGISIKEQLQLEIGKIIAKLTTKEITYKIALKEITTLFDDHEVNEDETVTEYYKQAWLDALEDYNPEETE